MKEKLTRTEYCRQWAKNNPEKRKAARDKWNAKNVENRKNIRRIKMYNLSDSEFNLFKSNQNNKCAICNSLPENTKRKELDIDHCHKTGKVRGLLCNNCNRGLGHLKDDVSLLNKAINYLNQFNNKEEYEQQ